MANGNGDQKLQGRSINGKSLNGYKIRSWGDLVAVATLLAMLLATVAWGLKLETELNELRSNHGLRIANLEARVADGILPRSDERIKAQGRRLDSLERAVDSHADDHP